MQELQDRLSKEKASQQAQQQREHEEKMRVQNNLRKQLYDYLPKVQDWLQQLNTIHRTGLVPFSYSRQMLCSEHIPKNAWEVITDGVAHRFGIYDAKLTTFGYAPHGCAVPQMFTKMGSEGGGCSGEDVWTDGVEWYIGRSRPVIVRDNIVNECRIKSTLRAIKEFEVYFNECLERLGTN